MLINIAAPKQEHQGMVGDTSTPLAPGAPPPLVVPHCRRCGLPVERFTIDPVSSPYYLAIQWHCCERTGGTRIPHDEVLHKRKHGGAVWVGSKR